MRTKGAIGITRLTNNTVTIVGGYYNNLINIMIKANESYYLIDVVNNLAYGEYISNLSQKELKKISKVLKAMGVNKGKVDEDNVIKVYEELVKGLKAEEEKHIRGKNSDMESNWRREYTKRLLGMTYGDSKIDELLPKIQTNLDTLIVLNNDIKNYIKEELLKGEEIKDESTYIERVINEGLSEEEKCEVVNKYLSKIFSVSTGVLEGYDILYKGKVYKSGEDYVKSLLKGIDKYHEDMYEDMIKHEKLLGSRGDIYDYVGVINDSFKSYYNNYPKSIYSLRSMMDEIKGINSTELLEEVLIELGLTYEWYYKRYIETHETGELLQGVTGYKEDEKTVKFYETYLKKRLEGLGLGVNISVVDGILGVKCIEISGLNAKELDIRNLGIDIGSKSIRVTKGVVRIYYIDENIIEDKTIEVKVTSPNQYEQSIENNETRLKTINKNIDKNKNKV